MPGKPEPARIEVKHREHGKIALMRLAVDPGYVSPSEAAWKIRRAGERKTETRMRYFLDQHIPVMVLLSNAESSPYEALDDRSILQVDKATGSNGKITESKYDSEAHHDRAQ